jgi:acyl-CoA reductase-like NAD-dependent aldehyde dehydrogenase
MKVVDIDLLAIQEARILVENAYEAQQKLMEFDNKQLNTIIVGIASDVLPYVEELAKDACEETGYGVWQHKAIKNQFVCTYLTKKLEEITCVGILSEDTVKKTMEVGVPLGVLVGFCPDTSPVSTTIFKTLIGIKSGNAMVFSPPPLARNTSIKLLDILMESATKHGLPQGALSYLSYTKPSGSLELINHPQVAGIINTEVPQFLEASLKSGKKVIYGGSGNGPVFIERTANIKKAVDDIINSKTFDNGLGTAAEHSIVVESCIAPEVKREMTDNGAYFMSKEESDSLGQLFFTKEGDLDLELVGICPLKLAKKAGFLVPKSTKVLISEQKYVFNENPYSKKKKCPVLAFYIEEDWRNACEKCIELLIGERQGHTLVIHSSDEEVIRQFILKKPVARVLVNTPAVFGSMGITTNLFPSLTLGSGAWGDGITSDNVTPFNLIYVRKVGYGVR